MMKLLRFTLFMSTIFCSQVFAKSVVVVHPDNAASLSAKDVQRIFLGKEKKFSTGDETIPVNLPADNTTRANFDDAVLGRSTAQVAAYWAKLVFTGKGIPPKEVNSDADVINLIKSNKSVIGYIDESAVTGDVKVVPLN